MTTYPHPRRSLDGGHLRPLHDLVLIRRAKHSGMSDGGSILLPHKHTKPGEGEVVAVGTGKVLPDGSVRAPAVGVGDTVFWPALDGTDVMLDEERYILIREGELMGVVGA